MIKGESRGSRTVLREACGEVPQVDSPTTKNLFFRVYIEYRYMVYFLEIRRFGELTLSEEEPRHPGQVLLEDFLRPNKISQTDLSDHLGWTYARLNEIVNKRRGLTAASALALADAFDIDPEFWMDCQRDWELWHAKKEHSMLTSIHTMGR